MATLSVTNLLTTDLYMAELYATIAAGATVAIDRKATELPTMSGLQAAITAGSVAVSVAYTADEKASGLVQQEWQAPEQITKQLTGLLVIRKAFTAGAPGTADDVTVYAAGALPFNSNRVLDAVAFVSTAVGGSTLQLRTATGGGGTLLAQVSSAATGRAEQTTSAPISQVVTNDGVAGLFIRRSDRGVAGELIITLRIEAQISVLSGLPTDSMVVVDSVTATKL